MRSLPQALRDITVPDLLAVSRLGGSTACVAKFAQGSQWLGPTLPMLPGGPAAAVGTLAHRVLERWVKSAGSQEPLAVFAAVYDQFREELRGDEARIAFAELEAVLGLAEWSWFRAWVLGRCEASDRYGPRSSRNGSSELPATETLTGVEVPLRSSALRLKGRADRIRRIGANLYQIRDFKSGRVRDDQGEVKETIALQLQAYGLTLLEAKPEAEVVLIADTGDELNIPFDVAARTSAREKIDAVMSFVPVAGTHPIRELAKAGLDCLGCAVRHLCGTYMNQAPAWWRSYPAGRNRISPDIWGTIIAIKEGIDSVDIVLNDAAGRRVNIDRLDRRHGLSERHVGQPLWLFDLESSGPARDFRGQRYHPRVFHELPRDQRERRAWGLQVFVGA